MGRKEMWSFVYFNKPAVKLSQSKADYLDVRNLWIRSHVLKVIFPKLTNDFFSFPILCFFPDSTDQKIICFILLNICFCFALTSMIILNLLLLKSIARKDVYKGFIVVNSTWDFLKQSNFPSFFFINIYT